MELIEEFNVKVELHQGSVLSPFIFTFVIDLVTELVMEDFLSEMYFEDLFLVSDIFLCSYKKFGNRAFDIYECKDLNVNLENTKVMVSGDTANNWLSIFKVCS